MNDKICELAGRLAGAPQVFIYSKRDASAWLEVIGQAGFHHDELEADWHIAGIDTAPSGILAFPDTSREQRLQSHPLLSQLPAAHSLLIFRVPVSEIDRQVVMVMVNPSQQVFEDHERIKALSLLIEIVAPEISAQHFVVQPAPLLGMFASSLPLQGLAESADPAPNASQTEQTFLLRTLPKRHRLLTRNGMSFTAIRSWRPPIKEFQLRALNTIKHQTSRDSFASMVAAEMADAVVSQHGPKFISQVVPVPGDGAGRIASFSASLADQIAKRLECTAVMALNTESADGLAHLKSAEKFVESAGRLKGATLVVDDVVNSGRHMALAVNGLRARGANCFAMGWITD